ncbi:unnamed protein product, partial [Brenthis ino]
MARTKYKCGISIVSCIFLLDFVNTLPILRSPTLETTDRIFTTTNSLQDEVLVEEPKNFTVDYNTQILDAAINNTFNVTGRSLERQSEVNIRRGQEVRNYSIQITRNGDKFIGQAILSVRVSEGRGEALLFHMVDLEVHRVQLGILTIADASDVNFDAYDDLLEVQVPEEPATTYVVIIDYSADFRSDGMGLYMGHFDDTPLESPVYLWGMVAHNFDVTNIPSVNVQIHTRQRVSNQNTVTSVAIIDYFNALNEWTEKPYDEIVMNQNERMNIIAVPDISRDWTALSTVCIWEPYILTENNNAIKHRKIALVKIAEGMSRQWFGYVLRPSNWKDQWFIIGLNTYVAYEIAKGFQTDPSGENELMIDFNTIFVTDVIQEGLLWDAYAESGRIEPENDIFEENEIRLLMNGVMQYKAPALIRMIRLAYGTEEDEIMRTAVRALIKNRPMELLTSDDFYDSLRNNGDARFDLEQWVNNNGYPLITASIVPNGVLLIQEPFSYTPGGTTAGFNVPITFTTSSNPDFNNLYTDTFVDNTNHILRVTLEENDWIILNLQGQGYYRVNYDPILWENLIEALDDPEERENIHPLNRATLLDDALNLARANRISYDVALQVAFTIQHETEYAVWRAFVRNMDFIRKRIVAFATIEEDRDDDIYLRLIRRIMGTFEEEIGFIPPLGNEPVMQVLTRGLVMDHACRSGYEPCIAAAVDLFYDPNDDGAVNPNIPPEIRPAVYCTMVREGGEEVIEALQSRLEIENSRYERLVILESLGCSQDEEFIRTLLLETIDNAAPYDTEERSKIFAAIASASAENAMLAMLFMSTRTNEIRNSYGGPEKLEECIFVLSDNMVTDDLALEFTRWVNSLDSISNIEDSDLAAANARSRINQNINWNNNLMEDVYEWIDENDAPTLFVSSFLICLTLFVSLFNN